MGREWLLWLVSLDTRPYFTGDPASLEFSEPECPQSTHILFCFLLPCLHKPEQLLCPPPGTVDFRVSKAYWPQVWAIFSNPLLAKKPIFFPTWHLLFPYLTQLQREEKLSYLGCCKYQLSFLAIILLCVNVCLAIHLLPDYKQLDSKTYFFSSLANPGLR